MDITWFLITATVSIFIGICMGRNWDYFTSEE